MIKKAMTYSLICLMLVNSITGCYTYKEFQGNEMNALEKGGEVKVTTLNEEAHYLSQVVFQDSVIIGKEMSAFKNIQIQIPLKEIKTVKVREVDWIASTLGVGFVYVVASYLVKWVKVSHLFSLDLRQD